MLATVTQYGEHTALILEQQILTRVHIDVNTLFDVEIEGQTLIMTPVQDEQQQQERNAHPEDETDGGLNEFHVTGSGFSFFRFSN